MTSNGVEETVHEGFILSRSIGDVPEAECVYDRTVNAVADLPESGPLAFVKSFYDQNEDTIKTTTTGLASLTAEGRSVESAVNTFTETAKVLIKGLDALAQVHPVIGVAVIAFKLVVTFDMTRRENNKKVLALKLEMQDMMAVLFELRHIRDPMEAAPDGLASGGRFQRLMEKIANDIKDAGSACDAYLKKSFLARTLKSKIYEDRLAEYGTTFEQDKTELQRALSLNIARGVNSANETLDKVDRNVNKLLGIFRKLESGRERDIERFFDENGGPKACIDNDDLLELLVLKSGETLAAVAGQNRKGDDLVNARKALLKEWQEDVEDMFKRNIVVFDRKLDVQSKQLEAIKASNERIVAILSSGSHERILDNDLRTIWREMGWKGSVKARHFVLALHDFYGDEPSLGGGQDVSFHAKREGSHNELTEKHSWALAYVNLAHVQPIIEAIDDDGTGFVSIKEVNAFVTSHPLEWTLLQRLAYWATGWHITISSYKNKIYTQVQKIFMLLDRVKAVNRGLVEQYLKSDALIRIEHILRSTQSVEFTLKPNAELKKCINIFEGEEEGRLEYNLASVAYELDSVETATLVIGPGRIERYLFPLVHLLLKQHIRTIMLACKCTLHEEEILVGLSSLDSVFRLVDERIERMAGIFKQVSADVNARFGLFAFGMFQQYYEKAYLSDDLFIITRANNSYLEWFNNTSDAQTDFQAEVDAIPITELRQGPFDLTAMDAQSMYPPNPFDPEIPEDLSLLGHWAGNFWCIREEGDSSLLGLVEIRIDTASHNKFAGIAQNWSGLFDVSGTINEDRSLTLFLLPEGIKYEAIFDPIRQRIEGLWKLRDLDINGETRALFLRTPSRLHRYLYTPTSFAKNPARSRWTFACNAILNEVRRKSWSWKYLSSQMSEIKRCTSLSIRRESRNITPCNLLDHESHAELVKLQQTLDIRVAWLCSALAQFHVRRTMVDHIYCRCDGCLRDIYDTRIICLVCVEKDFANSVDLCRKCMEKSVHPARFLHDSSHSMIKYERVVIDYQKVLFSRHIATHAKAILKEMETAEDTETKTVSIRCLCCSNAVTIPCWVCSTCKTPPDTFICSTCEESRTTSVNDHPHQLHHPLIRIGTTDPDPQNHLNDTVYDVESRLAALESKVDRRITHLEKMVQEGTAEVQKVQERLTQLEVNVQEKLSLLESNIQARFSGLENLLRRVIEKVD